MFGSAKELKGVSSNRARRRRLAALFLISATGLWTACGGSGGSSPTEPPMPGGNPGLTITFTGQPGVFGDQEETIRRLIQETWEQARTQINVSGLQVLVGPGPQRLIPGWGVGGTALNASTVELAVDPALAPELVEERLPSLTAHELHHLARIRGPGYGDTLLQAMVSEGLADHYAEELLGEPLPPWVTALTEEQYVFWFERAEREFDSTSYNHSQWFFGTGPQPNWTGYTIGFQLVSDYMDENPGTTATSLVNESANSFRPD